HGLSFDELYYPGMDFDGSGTEALLTEYHETIFGTGTPKADPTAATDQQGADANTDDASDPTLDNLNGDAAPQVLPAIAMGRLAWHSLIFGGWDEVAQRYVFDIHPLTNDRPYFAAYEKASELPNITDRLELFQDDWGYLLLWATLGVAAAVSLVLIALPVLLGWR